MANKTNNWNAYESSTTAPFVAGADSVQVDNADGLVAPIYLVIDPDVVDKREWILVRAINGTLLENIVRGLEGSVGTPGQGVDHIAGAKVRSVPTKQIFDDLFGDIETNAADLVAHVADTGDPHSAAGYMKLTTGDARYLNLVGGTMQGAILMGTSPGAGNKIRNLAAGTATGDAINWDQFQNAVAGGFDGDHASLTNVLTDQHHTKYTDAEAVLAMGPLNDNNDYNHNRYEDADAVAAIQASGDFYDTSETYSQTEVDNLISGLQSQITANTNAIGGKANTSHNHTAAQTTSGTFLAARIPGLDAGKIVSGVLSTARIPSLDTGKITTGVFSEARLPNTFSENYTFLGSLGVAGPFNANSTVNFSSALPINAGGVDLRLVGSAVTRSG